MPDARNPSDTPDEPVAILVLGAAVWAHGAPSPTLSRRTRHAAALWTSGVGRVVIPCGGLGLHPPAEATVMAYLLAELGVPRDAIYPEDQSTSTSQNIHNAKVILDGLGIRRAIIVSDAYHLPRARLLARREGLSVSVSAPPRKGARLGTQLRGALREVPAYLAALVGLSR